MLKEFMKNYERTCYLMFCHNGSALANQSHILMTVSAMNIHMAEKIVSPSGIP